MPYIRSETMTVSLQKSVNTSGTYNSSLFSKLRRS
ncbi:Uncharacterised protein [Vibrio cholerae]|nr:Uncharacterised protein [Vibrio cholerae]